MKYIRRILLFSFLSVILLGAAGVFAMPDDYAKATESKCCVQVFKTTLTAAQCATLKTTPVQVLPALGINTVNKVIGVMAKFNFGTTAYDGKTSLIVSQGHSVENQWFSLSALDGTGLINATSSGMEEFYPCIPVAIASSCVNVFPNTAWVIYAPIANPHLASGNGTLTIYVTYLEINL